MFKIHGRLVCDGFVEVAPLRREGLTRDFLGHHSLELVSSLLERLRHLDEVGQHRLACKLSGHGSSKEEIHQFVHNEFVCEYLGRFEKECKQVDIADLTLVLSRLAVIDVAEDETTQFKAVAFDNFGKLTEIHRIVEETDSEERDGVLVSCSNLFIDLYKYVVQ